MRADFLTKELNPGQHKSLTQLSGISPIQSPTVHYANCVTFSDPRASITPIYRKTSYLPKSSMGSIWNQIEGPSNVN